MPAFCRIALKSKKRKRWSVGNTGASKAEQRGISMATPKEVIASRPNTAGTCAFTLKTIEADTSATVTMPGHQKSQWRSEQRDLFGVSEMRALWLRNPAALAVAKSIWLKHQMAMLEEKGGVTISIGKRGSARIRGASVEQEFLLYWWLRGAANQGIDMKLVGIHRLQIDMDGSRL